MGDEDAAIRHLIESFPRLLLLSVESQLKPMIKFLERAGVQPGSMGNVLLLFPPIVFYDVKCMQKKLSVFEEVIGLKSNI